MELFKLEPGLAIWTWISFGILFFILWKFVLPVILKNLEDREGYIASAVDNAEKIDSRLREIDAEREEIIRKANIEADGVIQRTREEAEQLRLKLTKQAEDEAAGILEQARKNAAAEREAVFQALQDDLADLVCDASEKVVGTAFVTDSERSWIKEAVETL